MFQHMMMMQMHMHQQFANPGSSPCELPLQLLPRRHHDAVHGQPMLESASPSVSESDPSEMHIAAHRPATMPPHLASHEAPAVTKACGPSADVDKITDEIRSSIAKREGAMLHANNYGILKRPSTKQPTEIPCKSHCGDKGASTRPPMPKKNDPTDYLRV